VGIGVVVRLEEEDLRRQDFRLPDVVQDARQLVQLVRLEGGVQLGPILRISDGRNLRTQPHQK
jgi:hypothetical protein